MQLDKDFLEAHLDLAHLELSKLGEYEQAVEHLDIAIQAKFKLAEALVNRGGVRYEMWKRSVAQAAAPETSSTCWYRQKGLVTGDPIEPGDERGADQPGDCLY